MQQMYAGTKNKGRISPTEAKVKKEVQMRDYDAICKYCGDKQPILAESQAEADELTSEQCSCGGATKARKREMLLKNIESICGGGAGQYGYDRVPESVQELINQMGERVLQGEIEAATIKLIDGSVIVKLSSKGAACVNRTTINKIGLEA